jgi:aminoglycoside phosphotransferase (APT) family kinase protein
VSAPLLDATARAEVEARFGAVRQAVAVGSRPGTFIVVAGGRRLVAKTLRNGWTAAETERLDDVLAAAAVPRAPLLACSAEWAFFGWVEGTPPRPASAGWDAAWDAAFTLLVALRSVRPPLAADPGARWLERVAETAGACPAAADALAIVTPAPAAARSLAHGDFAPQNFLHSPAGLVVVDWEEAGAADDGFDAGWLLALNRLGAGPRLPRPELAARLEGSGFAAAALRRWEGVGLLRMHYRVHHGTGGGPAGPLHAAVGRALADFVAE